MTIDGDDDLQGLRRAGRAAAEARDAMLSAVAPGVATSELDAVGRDVLRVHGARSAPQLAVGFPATTCISVNDEAAHGVPSPPTAASPPSSSTRSSSPTAGRWS